MHPKGANSMAASGLGCRNDLVRTGRAILFFLHKESEKQAISSYRTSISSIQEENLDTKELRWFGLSRIINGVFFFSRKLTVQII